MNSVLPKENISVFFNRIDRIASAPGTASDRPRSHTPYHCVQTKSAHFGDVRGRPFCCRPAEIRAC